MIVAPLGGILGRFCGKNREGEASKRRCLKTNTPFSGRRFPTITVIFVSLIFTLFYFHFLLIFGLLISLLLLAIHVISLVWFEIVEMVLFLALFHNDYIFFLNMVVIVLTSPSLLTNDEMWLVWLPIFCLLFPCFY